MTVEDFVRSLVEGPESRVQSTCFTMREALNDLKMKLKSGITFSVDDFCRRLEMYKGSSGHAHLRIISSLLQEKEAQLAGIVVGDENDRPGDHSKLSVHDHDVSGAHHFGSEDSGDSPIDERMPLMTSEIMQKLIRFGTRLGFMADFFHQ